MIIKHLITLLLLSSSVNASRFYFSPGLVAVSSNQSNERASNGNPLIDKGVAFGLQLDTEVELPLLFSLSVGLHYSTGATKSEYSYTNPDDPADSGVASELDTRFSHLSALPILRLNFLTISRVRFFAGLGYYFADHSLLYFESDYEKINGNTIGFKDSSSTLSKGAVKELGFKYMLDKKGKGLQFTYKEIDFKSGKFDTLNQQEISSTQKHLSIQYVHGVDWSFFWK